MTVAVIPDLTDSPAVLNAAADLIEANGLHKWDRWPGAWQDSTVWEPGMPLCAMAALCMVCGKTDSSAIANTAAVRALIRYLSGNANAYAGLSAGENRYYEIANWSDKRATTQTDVVQVMRKVAEIEESRIAAVLAALEAPATDVPQPVEAIEPVSTDG